MLEVCGHDKCCGCMACIDICPSGAIKTTTDKYSVSMPIINQDLCIDCGLCKNVCPQIVNRKNKSPEICYAAFINSKHKREESASGGVGRALYEAFLGEDESIVFGVEFKDGINAVYSFTDNISDIIKYQGSRYVQADSRGLFNTLADLLRDNKRVLLISTPCVIVAACNFLIIEKVSLERLFTVDLLCHGVSPEAYLHEELEYLSNKYKWKMIKSVTFRSNKKFRNWHFVVSAVNKSGRVIEYNRYANEDPYFSAFLDGIILREGCYNCKYASPERVGDLSIGDFIGLGNDDRWPKVPFDKVNNSLIISNTCKGEELLDKARNELIMVKRDFAEAYMFGSSFKGPCQENTSRRVFLNRYPNEGFMKAIEAANGERNTISSRWIKVVRPVKRLMIEIFRICRVL